MSRIYKAAPLPFQGQKRFFVESYKKALIEMNQTKEIKIIVDLFGGSGLLSHTAKQVLPECQVIYNDFDNYHQRIKNIPKTNLLLEDLRELVKDEPQDKRISDAVKARLEDRIRAEEQKVGYIDYITISGSLLFSGNYANSFEELAKQRFYNTVRKSNYEPADGYLEGLDILRQDYRVLYERYKNIEGVVFVIDPPYLSTDVSTYSNYWKLADYLDVLGTLKDSSFVYFTSNKSQIVELLDWFNINYNMDSPFTGAKRLERCNPVSSRGKYTDIMIYKRV